MCPKPWRALPLAASSLIGPSPTPTLSGVHFSLLLSGFLLEFHVAKVHDAPSQLINAHLLLSTEAQHVKGNLQGHREEKAKKLQASHSRVEATTLPLHHGVDFGDQTHPDQGGLFFSKGPRPDALKYSHCICLTSLAFA